jgi:hypothetical protein
MEQVVVTFEDSVLGTSSSRVLKKQLASINLDTSPAI